MTEFDYGPAEFMVVRFAEENAPQNMWGALVDLVATGTIRLLDLVFVSRTLDGQVELLEYEDLGDATLTLEASGLAGSEDVDDIADLIEPGTSGAIIVLEHVWAKNLASAFYAGGGEMVFAERIPAPAVNALLAEVEEGEDRGAGDGEQSAPAEQTAV